MTTGPATSSEETASQQPRQKTDTAVSELPNNLAPHLILARHGNQKTQTALGVVAGGNGFIKTFSWPRQIKILRKYAYSVRILEKVPILNRRLYFTSRLQLLLFFPSSDPRPLPHLQPSHKVSIWYGRTLNVK